MLQPLPESLYLKTQQAESWVGPDQWRGVSAPLSDTTSVLISFRQSTPPQNRQLIVYSEINLRGGDDDARLGVGRGREERVEEVAG